MSAPPVAGPSGVSPARGARARLTRRIGWQGFVLPVPDDWDLTGYSGTDREGYLRADDSDALGIEVKWATESARSKTPPDLDARRAAFLSSLRKAARKKKIAFEERETEAPRGVERSDRRALGFQWGGDRKAYGALWHCATCRRVVIAQVLGEPSGRKGLAGVAEAVLEQMTCHGADPAWNLWSLYDLDVEVPSEYALASAQLMNVYLRLSFARGTSRLSVEQWGAANVARADQYLDLWLAANSRAEIGKARFGVEEAQVRGHRAVRMAGGLAVGTPMVEAVREAASIRMPATRFSAMAWECPESNKIFAVQGIRPARTPDRVADVAERTRCHGASGEDA